MPATSCAARSGWSASSTRSRTCTRGTTSTWIGAWGLMSRNPITVSSEKTTSTGMSPATIAQNKQPSITYTQHLSASSGNPCDETLTHTKTGGRAGTRSSGRFGPTARPEPRRRRSTCAAPGRRGAPRGRRRRRIDSSSDGLIPPSGPTMTRTSPWSVSGTAVRAAPASSCSTSRARRGRDQADQAVPVDRVGDHRDPRPAALLRRLPDRPPPPFQALGRPFAPPLHYRALGLPRHDLVHPELGQEFQRQFGPIALGQCLDDHQPRVVGRHGLDRFAVQIEVVAAGGGHRCDPPRAPPVGEEQLLTDPQPPHRRGVPTFRTVEPNQLIRRQRVEQEQRQAHRRDGSSRAEPRRVGPAAVTSSACPPAQGPTLERAAGGRINGRR